MPGAAAALAGGSIVGGLMQGRAAGKAAKAQQEASEAAVAEQRRQFDLSREDLAPYRQAGSNALAAMQYMTGIGPQPTFGGTGEGGSGGTQNALTINEIAGTPGGGGVRNTTPWRSIGDGVTFALPGGGRETVNDNRAAAELRARYAGGGTPTRFQVGDEMFDSRDAAQSYIDNLGQQGGGTGDGTPFDWQTTPGYEFRVGEAEKGLDRMAAARGMRLSGATMREAMRQRDGMAASEFGNVYNRLAGISGTGQTAVNTGVSMGQSTANNIGNALISGGNARASGYQNQANAFSGTINALGSIGGAAYGGIFGPKPGFGITPSPAGLNANWYGGGA